MNSVTSDYTALCQGHICMINLSSSELKLQPPDCICATMLSDYEDVMMLTSLFDM